MFVVLFLVLVQTHAHAAQVLFTPVLRVSEEYSDNIYLAPENEEDDYINTVSLDMTLQVLGRTAGMELNLNPALVSFANHSELNYWRYAARAHLWNDLSRNTRVEITDDYLETEDPLDESADFTPDDPTTGPVIGTDESRRDRNRYRTNITEGRLSHQFGARDNVYVSLLYGLLEDIDPQDNEEVDDYTNWQPSLGLAYWFAQRWGVELNGYYSARDYTDENDREEYTGYLRLLHQLGQRFSGFVEYRHTYLNFDEETDYDFNLYAPSAGIIYQFENTANITVGGGYYRQEFEDADDEEDEEGWFVFSQIYKRWAFQSSHIDLTGMSGYRIDDRGAEDLGLNIYYAGRLELGHRFTQHLSASVYGSYRYDEYPNDIPVRIDRTVDSGSEIAYQALRWLNVSLAYNYRDVSSDIETEEYTENSVVLMFTITPTTPYRLN